MIINAEPTFTEHAESELITLVQAGDRHAFERLYNMHKGKVYGLCLRLTADPSLAEDALQEVFIQLWQKISGFHGQSKFSTWLHSVSSNITISLLRKQKNWMQKVVSLEDSGMDESAIEACPLLDGLDKLIVRLPERARMVFVLHAVEGYRHEEIGKMLNMATGSSKAQYHRARQLLKEWVTNNE